MRRPISLTLLVLLLAACQSAPATPSATVAPTPAALPSAAPTPTSLAEGLLNRLATPAAPGCPEPYPWFFDNRAGECAGITLNTWAVLQPFERGLMLWLQEGGRTYVLIDDGSLFKPYVEVSDPGNTALPGPDPAIVPPAGLYQPELGFAKFWRGLAPGSEWIRNRLGWALAPETGYSALWQCNTAADATARCYLSGPGDEIISLTRGGAQFWNYWQGPVR